MEVWRVSNQTPDGEFTRYQQYLAQLNQRQRDIFAKKLIEFERYLRKKGKDPLRGIGYAEGSIPTRVSRVLTVIDWIWNTAGHAVGITANQADTALVALKTDEITRNDGKPYSGESKRKISDALDNWMAFEGLDWEAKVSFDESGTADNQADPFTKHEAKVLWETSLEYKSIPSYNNLTPKERDEWRRYLAQELGKSTDEVTPDDWEAVNQDWKIPSIVGSTRCAAWRPAGIGRMQVDWYYPDKQKIVIPGEYAVKNDDDWEQVLADYAARALDNWLEQRSNMEKYDGRSEMWLTRKGNPYSSNTLNSLLGNLIEDAGINAHGRNLVWYSWRHYVGSYLYEEYKDLKIVAEKLRQNNLSTASRYVHPTDEIKQEAANLL